MVQARADEMRQDWREECRLAVSGAFLAQRSEAEMLKQNLGALKERVSGLEKALTLASREEDFIKKEMARADFDPALAEREVAAKDRVALLKTQIQENTKFHADARAKLATLSKDVAAFETRLKKVFRIDRPKSESREPVLSYLTSCPRFEDVCPLPQKEREALLKVAGKGTLPLACERYAHIRAD